MRQGKETYHNERSNDPVHHDTKSDLDPDLSFPEDMM